MSFHARTAGLLEDRDGHEDADLKKKTRGGTRVIGKARKIKTHRRVRWLPE